MNKLFTRQLYAYKNFRHGNAELSHFVKYKGLSQNKTLESLINRRHLFTWLSKFSHETNNSDEFWSKPVIAIIVTVGISLFIGLKLKSVKSLSYREEGQTEEKDKDAIDKEDTIAKAIPKARDLIQRIKDETGSPGIVVGVSVDGKNVWTEGLGYSDVENRTPCSPNTVFRIASISKSITMGMLAKLWENGDLDIDKPIQHYLPQYPVKHFNGEKVDITTRQLLSHLGGIRHYDKDYMEEENTTNKEKRKKTEYENKEYYIKKHYESVTDSLVLFKDDPLVHKPGSKFLYTSYGWTLISAVMEKAANKPFDKLMEDYFRGLGLEHTYLERNDPLVYHRGRHYLKNDKGRLVNAPYVDNSYKWAGGGFISDIPDLLKFGNIMLYSYQLEGSDPQTGSDSQTGIMKKGDNPISQNSNSETICKEHNPKQNCVPGFLRKETVSMLFSPVDKTECSWDKNGVYGMGWAVIPEKYENGHCKHQRHYVSHTGGAVGASSVLLILPSINKDSFDSRGGVCNQPKGVIVAVIANMGSINLNGVALEIAKLFEPKFKFYCY